MTRPEDTADTPADPLHAHFMGRRAWHRVASDHRVSLRGVGGTSYEGLTVDISRGGILVAVIDQAFQGQDRDGVSLIQDHFPEGVEIVFVDTGIARQASIVRATLQRGAHLALGCQFEKVLGVGEALELGIVAGESGVQEAGTESLPLVPRRGVLLSLVLQGAGDSLVGPLALGQVVAVGERTLEAIVTRGVDAVVSACGYVPVEAAVQVGRTRVWSGRASLVGCTPEMEGTRVRLLADEPFNRAFRKRLKDGKKAAS